MVDGIYRTTRKYVCECPHKTYGYTVIEDPHYSPKAHVGIVTSAAGHKELNPYTCPHTYTYTCNRGNLEIIL